jgi:succinoglycan biosynthesis protein ExoW
MATEHMIAVIIPFFQREPGILRRAVDSALGQVDAPLPWIVVVNDGSPVDPHVELADLLQRFPRNLEIISQDNAGPGAARNKGLRHVRDKASLVAFLDSDDMWEPRHLHDAILAFEAGADFYFCDALHRDLERTIFATKDFPDLECRALVREASTFEYVGDFFQLILERCPVATPAVVFRPSTLLIQFREEMRTAGEDYFFWFEVAQARKRVAFSTHVNVKLGTGINIYNGVEWGTNASINRTYDLQRYVSALRERFPMTAAQGAVLEKRALDHRRDVAAAVCSLVFHRKRLDVRLLYRYAKIDPLVVPYLPWYLVRRLTTSVARRWRPSTGR